MTTAIEPYRAKGDNGPEAPAPVVQRPKGPMDKCPACGNAPQSAKFCWEGKRRPWRLSGCKCPGSHMHQMCGACECTWVCDPKNEVARV